MGFFNNFKVKYSKNCTWLAETLVYGWETYWKSSTNLLPEFLEKILKGTLIWGLSTVAVLYAAAWFIYGIPVTDHPVFILGSTVLSLLADFPALVVRIFTRAPLDMTYSEILKVAIQNYMQSYVDFIVSIFLLVFISVTYIGFILKTALYYRRSDQRWNRWLAYGTLFMFGLSAACLFYYYTVPFIEGVLKEGFAFRIIRNCWQFVESILNLDPRKRNEQKHKENVSYGTNSNNDNSATSNQGSRNFSGRAGSPSEPNGRTWGEFLKGKSSEPAASEARKQTVETPAAPKQPTETPPFMGSRDGMQQMSESTLILEKQVSAERKASCEELRVLMQNPKATPSDVDFAKGKCHANEVSHDQVRDCLERQNRIAHSTVHTPRDPENLEELRNRFYAVSADRAGQGAGYLAEKGLEIAFNRTLLPDEPVSPRPYDEVN